MFPLLQVVLHQLLSPPAGGFRLCEGFDAANASVNTLPWVRPQSHVLQSIVDGGSCILSCRRCLRIC